MSVFSSYARYYDLLYRDKDYAGEAAYVHKLIQKFKPGAKTLLELGCGTGKHALLLAQQGYALHGVDQSTAMLEQAQQLVAGTPQAGQLSFGEGDVRTYKTASRFDVVISLFHVVSYLPTNTDLHQMFANAREHLNPGGLFLFDVWYGPCVLTEPPAVRVKRMEDEHSAIMRVVEPQLLPNENAVALDYTVFIRDKQSGGLSQLTEHHHMRYLFTPEIEALFTGAQMRPAGSAEWLTDRQPNQHTFGVWFAGLAV